MLVLLRSACAAAATASLLLISALPDTSSTHRAVKRIVGGADAVGDQKLPFVAYVINSLNHASGGAQCSGSVISDRWIVTSGHCVYNRDEWGRVIYHSPAPPSQVSVIVGNPEAGKGERYEASQVILHPHIYTSSLGANVYANIALLETKHAMYLGGSMQRIRIADGAASPLPQNTSVLTAGWGGDGTAPSGLLQVVNQVTADQEDCSNRRTGKGVLEDTRGWDILCTSQIKGHTTCRGDGGSPLFIRTENIPLAKDTSARSIEARVCRGKRQLSVDSEYTLLGVLSSKSSHSSDSIRCFSEDGYDIYTSLPYFLDWILNTTNIARKDLVRTDGVVETSAAGSGHKGLTAILLKVLAAVLILLWI
ncbi:trypsin-like serine protease [Martensiomyces pterosporus]|nr:trypsin-like serine protease [Martensiomyces pterosporus]